MRKIVLTFLYLFSFLFLSAQEVFKNEDLSVTQLIDHLWVIETTDNTSMYIIEGEDQAMLIDTGTKCEALDEVVRKITSKSLIVLITHNHRDHAGNIKYFDEVYMHPADTLVPINNLYVGHYPHVKRPLEIDYITDMKNLALKLSEGDTTGAEDYPNMGLDISSEKPMIAVNGKAMIVFDSEKIN